jgi:hypothetical protein
MNEDNQSKKKKINHIKTLAGITVLTTAALGIGYYGDFLDFNLNNIDTSAVKTDTIDEKELKKAALKKAFNEEEDYVSPKRTSQELLTQIHEKRSQGDLVSSLLEDMRSNPKDHFFMYRVDSPGYIPNYTSVNPSPPYGIDIEEAIIRPLLRNLMPTTNLETSAAKAEKDIYIKLMSDPNATYIQIPEGSTIYEFSIAAGVSEEDRMEFINTLVMSQKGYVPDSIFQRMKQDTTKVVNGRYGFGTDGIIGDFVHNRYSLRINNKLIAEYNLQL